MCSDTANGCVFDAVPAVMMYRSKVCGREWADSETEEPIDRSVVRLLRPAGS